MLYKTPFLIIIFIAGLCLAQSAQAFQLVYENGIAYDSFDHQPNIVKKFVRAHPDCQVYFEKEKTYGRIRSDLHAGVSAKLLNGGSLPMNGTSKVISMNSMGSLIDDGPVSLVKSLTCLESLIEFTEIEVISISEGLYSDHPMRSIYRDTILRIAQEHQDKILFTIAAANHGLDMAIIDAGGFATSPQDLCRTGTSKNLICVSGGKLVQGVIQTAQNHGDRVHVYIYYQDENRGIQNLLSSELYPDLTFNNTSEMAPFVGFVATQIKSACGVLINRDNLDAVFANYRIPNLPVTVPFRSRNKVIAAMSGIAADLVLRDIEMGSICTKRKR